METEVFSILSWLKRKESMKVILYPAYSPNISIFKHLFLKKSFADYRKKLFNIKNIKKIHFFGGTGFWWFGV
jgi:hypothetical protein